MIKNPRVIERLLGQKKVVHQASTVESLAKYFGFNKKSLFIALRVLLISFSLASAHYSGFMSHIPFELVSLVAVDLLPAFISVFIFYFILCYTIARVFAFGLSQFYAAFFHMLAALGLRLRRHWPIKFGRAGAKLYKEAKYYEPITYWLFCSIILVVVFDFSYLKFDSSILSNFSILLAGGIVCALISKAGFLARPPWVVFKRIFDRKRVALRRSILRAFIFFLTGGALVLSFFTGYIRFDKLMGESEVLLDVGEFAGSVNVLMSSNGSFVVVDQKTTPETYYFINDKLMVSLQDKKKDESESKED